MRQRSGKRRARQGRNLAGMSIEARDDRPWGYEEIVYSGEYKVKRLTVRAGHRLSLQYHPEKVETIVVLFGVAGIQLGDDYALYGPGSTVHVPVGTLHRLSAPQGDVVFIEASTVTEGTVRIEDDYGRATSSPVTTLLGTLRPVPLSAA